MKILVDGQACQTDSRDRGIGRYVLGFTDALARSPGIEAYVMLGRGDPDRLREARRRIRAHVSPVPVAACPYPSPVGDVVDLEQRTARATYLLRQQYVAAVDPDVVIIPSVFEGFDGGAGITSSLAGRRRVAARTVAIAHDVIPLLFPDRYLASRRYNAWYRERLSELLGFDLILANSQSTKDDLVRLCGADPGRITVIGAGLDPALLELASTEVGSRQGEDELAKIGVRSPFILVVGNGDWRKNNVGALEAYRRLSPEVQSTHQLVFTQVGDDIRGLLENVDSRELAQRVVVLGNVDDRTLVHLYRRCEVFFFPSLYEGFGLPVLEAMAFGAAVLSSNRGALPEVARGGEGLFDPENPDAMAAVLADALQSTAVRDRLREGAQAHAQQFDWAKCAALAVDAIGQLDLAKKASGSYSWVPTDPEIGVLADAVESGSRAALTDIKRGLLSIASGGSRRLLVDVTYVADNQAWTGIQRVVRNYCAGFHAIASERGLEFIPFRWSADGIRHARTYCRDALGLHTQGDDEILEVLPNDLVFMLDSTWEDPERFDAFLHDVVDNGGEIVWMVYDLVPVRVPETCHPGMPPAFRHWLAYAIARTDGFLCISEATRMDLERYLDESLLAGQRRPWTRSLHLGCDLESGAPGAATEAGAQVLKALEGRDFALAVGTIEPRKDYLTILSGFESAWTAGSETALVIVGKAGWNVEALTSRIRAHAELGRRLFWLSEASDGDIQRLLSLATVLVQASMLEGFGLPVVEAGSQGVPLLLSDIPVFREIAGDEAEYFEPCNAQSLANRLLEHGGSVGWRRPTGIQTMTWLESSRRMVELLLPGSVRAQAVG